MRPLSIFVRLAVSILVLMVALVATSGPVHAATITVTTEADEFGTGAECSLREAIQAANTNAEFGGCPAGDVGSDTITLPPGTYELTIAGDDEDLNATGDLDVLEDLIIRGDSEFSTIILNNIAADPKDRVIDLQGMGASLKHPCQSSNQIRQYHRDKQKQECRIEVMNKEVFR